MNEKNHPGIYLPPPVIYVAFFFCALVLQRAWPIDKSWLHTTEAHIVGWIFVALYFLFAVIAIAQFVISKNTIVTIKPATSLQTTGIFAFSRNPMYLGLVLLYSGLAVFFGNWWTFILLPMLIIILEHYVIRKEERYLQCAFGEQYDAYRRRVRRWI